MHIFRSGKSVRVTICQSGNRCIIIKVFVIEVGKLFLKKNPCKFYMELKFAKSAKMKLD